MKQITILHASEDDALAQQLERQLLHADKSMRVVHNNNAMYGKNIEEEWTKTLFTSHLFVILISADLTSSQKIMDWTLQAIRRHSDRIIPVLVRPCMLDDGHTFEGCKVIPNKAITNYSGAAKESIWLQVVRFILDRLSDASEPVGYHTPVRQPYQQPAPPARKFVRQRESVQLRPMFAETVVAPVIELKPALPREPQAIDVVVLSATQDRAWLEYIDRTFRIMERQLPIHMTIHHNPECARESVLDAAMTIVLVSPDFLASEYNTLYQELHPVLYNKKPIIPVMLRECEFNNNITFVPRDGAIKCVGNDAAWNEVSKEIRRIMKSRGLI